MSNPNVRYGKKAASPAAVADKSPAAAVKPKPAPQPPVEDAIALAEQRVRQAELALDGARAAQVRSQREVKVARVEVSKQIGAWVAGFGALRTAESVARETIASNQELKRQIAEGLVSPVTDGRVYRSAVDVTAHYGHGGSIDGSRGSAFRRGSFPASARGRRVAVR
jgi:hypothetical protein